jgi:hypothetical protein
MTHFIYCCIAALLVLVATSQALPIFDTELVASPLMHEVRINYRGGRKSPTTDA